jgi:hypothetical protein
VPAAGGIPQRSEWEPGGNRLIRGSISERLEAQKARLTSVFL